MKEYIGSIFKYPKSFKRFILIQLVLGIGSGIWSLNMNYFLIESGLDSSYIGKLNAISPIVTALFSLYSGYLCDKLNYKRVLGIGLAMKWASMILTIIAPIGTFIFFARIISGISEAMIIISSYPYATSLVDEKHKNTAYSLFFSSSMIALFIGNFTGGFCATIVSGSDKYDITLIISSIVCMVGNLMLLWLPEIKKETTVPVGFYFPRNSSVLWSLIFNFIGYMQYFLATSMLNIIFRDFFGVKEWTIGLFLGAMGLLGGLVSFMVPWIVEKIGRKMATIWFFVIIFLSYIMMAFSNGTVFILMSIISTLFSVSIVALLEGPMLQKIPEEEKGRFSGVKNLLTSIGTGFGIYLAGRFINLGVSGLFFLYIIVSIFLGVQLGIYYYKFSDYLDNNVNEKFNEDGILPVSLKA